MAMSCNEQELEILKSNCDPFVYKEPYSLENFETCVVTYALVRNCIDYYNTVESPEFVGYTCELENEFGYIADYPYKEYSNAYKWVKENLFASLANPTGIKYNFTLFDDTQVTLPFCIEKVEQLAHQTSVTDGTTSDESGAETNASHGVEQSQNDVSETCTDPSTQVSPDESGAETNASHGAEPSQNDVSQPGIDPSAQVSPNESGAETNASHGAEQSQNDVSQPGIDPSAQVSPNPIAGPPVIQADEPTTTVVAQLNNESGAEVEDNTKLVTIIVGTCVILVLVPIIAITVALIKG